MTGIIIVKCNIKNPTTHPCFPIKAVRIRCKKTVTQTMILVNRQMGTVRPLGKDHSSSLLLSLIISSDNEDIQRHLSMAPSTGR